MKAIVSEYVLRQKKRKKSESKEERHRDVRKEKRCCGSPNPIKRESIDQVSITTTARISTERRVARRAEV